MYVCTYVRMWYIATAHHSHGSAPTLQSGLEPSKMQWNLSIKDTLSKGHLSTEDSVCCPNHTNLCTNLPLIKGHLSNEDTVCSPNHTDLCTNLPLIKGHLSNEDTVCSPNHTELCTNLPLN